MGKGSQLLITSSVPTGFSLKTDYTIPESLMRNSLLLL